MMEFSDIEPLKVQLITTKDGEVFRRFRSDMWEVKRDDQWKVASDQEALEDIYQAHCGKTFLQRRIKVMKELAGELPVSDKGTDKYTFGNLMKSQTIKELREVKKSANSFKTISDYQLALYYLADFCCNTTKPPSIGMCAGAVANSHQMDKLISVGKKLADKIPEWQAQIRG